MGRQGFIGADAASFSFHDLIALKTLLKLREQRIPPRIIGRALDSLKSKLADVERPLSELKIISDGGKIAVQIGGQRMDAISGQLLLNFDETDFQKLAAFPIKAVDPAVKEREAEAHFQHGLQLEETGAPVEEVVAAYKKAIAANPFAAGALVNLGTLYYRMRKFSDAESHYQKALEADANIRWPISISATSTTKWATSTAHARTTRPRFPSIPAIRMRTSTWRCFARGRDSRYRRWRIGRRISNWIAEVPGLA